MTASASLLQCLFLQVFSMTNEILLDELLGQLESARAWSPRVISKLETLIRAGDDYALFRLNPIQFATEKGVAETECIDLFLYSARVGLFEMEWHLVCATCGNVVESFRNMHKLHSTYICNQCAFENTATLDDYIQVSFTISRAVREIAFHHPEQLSADDYLYKYKLARGVHSWLTGWSHENLIRTVTKLLAYLEPGQRRQVEFPTELGVVFITNLTGRVTAGFPVSPDVVSTPQTITMGVTAGRFQITDRETPGGRLDFGYAALNFDHLGSLCTGTVAIEIENHMEQRACMWAAHFTGAPPRAGITFDPFLSGKRLITTQTFRDLFRSETVPVNEGIGVKDITFLFTDLKGSTALYDQIGDPQAYFLVRQHFDTLGHVIQGHAGAIVKTIGDAVMAAFMNPLDATRAALEMLRDIEAFNRNISDKLVLKIGIHSGHSIVVNLNDRLDYFGQTVNIASRIQGLADAGEIYISQDVYSHPGVQEVLAGCRILPEQVAVKGVSETLQVYKVSAAMQEDPG
jgi:class 3 adenylate cyclase